MTLTDRVAALEAADTAIANVHINGSYCDAGPYDVVGLLGLWHPDGTFYSDNDVFSGHDGLERFYTSLAADFGVHMFSNLAVESMSPEEVKLRCYGIEFPVFRGLSLLGLFPHEVTCRFDEAGGRWVEWRQGIACLCEFEAGWEDGPRVVDQTKEGTTNLEES